MTPTANTTPLSGTTGGGFCSACGAALSTGARFCHRCGNPAGQGAPVITPASQPTPKGSGNVIPWALAFVAVLALVAYSAGRNFGKAKGSAVDGSSNAIANAAIDGPAAAAAAAGRAPDISQMSPSEMANRLYIRVMTAAENNQMDSAAFLAERMAIPAHEMLENPSNDERYHLARIAEIAGDSTIARAQTDTILKNEPNSLLGLMMGSRAALMNNNAAKAKQYDQQLLKALDTELKTDNVDYQMHRAEIDRAAADARRSN